MNDQQKRKLLKERLEGHWEYECHVNVHSNARFEKGESGRGGHMAIRVTLTWTGVSADIDSERLWKITRPDGQKDVKELAEPVKWKAEGDVSFRGDVLSFRYTANDVGATGWTTDSFVLTPDSLDLNPGVFEHICSDGKVVTGTVRLRKMVDSEDFRWGPKGVKSGVGRAVSVTDDKPDRPRERPKTPSGPGIVIDASHGGQVNLASGDQASASAEQIQITAGKLAELELDLRTIEVAANDIEAIKTIVKQERPQKGTTLGDRAAAWVGEMVRKGLTGAWRVGENVTSKVLTEILLKYYG